MRVLLIRPNSRMRTVFLPLGMGYVANAARQAGHDVSMLDARRERLTPSAVARIVRDIRPDVIGLSAMHFEKKGLMELTRGLKDGGIDAPLVLGGPLVSTCGEELVREGIVARKWWLHLACANRLRADRMDEELIDLLKKAGTYRINYAIETASPRLQKYIHKSS